MRANRYVSYLAAEIEPKAVATLAQFERAAEKTMERIAAVQSRGTNAAGRALGGALQADASRVRTAANSIERDLGRVNREAERTGRAAQIMGTGFQRASLALGVVQGPLGPLAGRLSALGSILERLSGFSLAGVLSGGGAFALGNVASQYAQVGDRLRPLFEDQRRFNNAMAEVVEIAKRTRQELAPVADLYSKITLAGREAGITDARSARITELAAKAAKISGGAAATQEAGLTQFAQGFGSGTLAGEELKSIRENTLRLATALSDGLDVPFSKLKELGREGKLTPEVIAAALENSADKIEAEYARIPKRIGTSLTELGNAFAVFVGNLDNATGATSNIAGAISLVAGNLDTIVPVLAVVAAGFAASSFATFAQKMTTIGASLLTATANFNALRNEVAAGNAVMLNSAEAVRQRAAFVAQAAETERAAAQTAASGARAYQDQLRAQLPLLQRQISAQRESLEVARRLDAASRARGEGGRPDLVKAGYAELNTSMRALVLTEQQLAAATAELAAAEQRLAAATASATAATTASAAAESAAVAASTRLGAAKLFLATAIQRVASVGASLVNFLGGPWGIAFGAAALAVAVLAGQTNSAADAARRFEGDQASLAARLGFTTDKLREQSAAARQLAVDLARANLLRAKGTFGEVANDTANVLQSRAFTLRPFDFSQSAVQDRNTLIRLAKVLRRDGGQGLSARGQSVLRDIIRRNPDLARDSELQDTLIGLNVGRNDFQRAIDDASGVNTELNKPRIKIDTGGGGRAETPAARRARLNREAKIAGADTGLAKAKAELAKARAEGPGANESDADYIARIADMERAVKSLSGAQGGAARATRSAEAARKAEAAALETASDKADRLAGIMDRFTVDNPIRRLEKLQDEADKAKRAIDDLVGERVEGYEGTFSKADAEKQKSKIDDFVASEARKPVTDSIADEKRRLDNLELQLRGEGDLAKLIERRGELEKQVGDLREDEIEAIARQIERENKLNDVYAQRNAIIENNAQFLGRVKDAGRDGIRSILGGDLKGGLKGFVEGVRNAYLDAKSNEIANKIFGDPEKKYRDEMSRGLNNSAARLTTSATDLKAAASALDQAAGAIQSSANQQGFVKTENGTITAAGAGASIGNAIAGLQVSVDGLERSVDQLGKDGNSFEDDQRPIVISAPAKKPIDMPTGIDGVLSRLFGGQKFGGAGGIGEGLLQLLPGAISSIFPASNKPYKGQKLDSVLGPLGQMVTQFLPAPIQAGISIGNALSQAVGVKPFAGGIFGAVGNVIASVLGFGKKKTPSGGAVITSLSGNYKELGKGDARTAAISGADSITSGLQKILDAVGGTLGTFAVTFGQHDGDYRVNTSGGTLLKAGNPGVYDFNDDAEGAIRFAILDAIKDGAIQGIREGTKRILEAGKDLDYALQKALKFEDVFRRLKKFKDPVGAAIDDLNREFKSLIEIFKEAQATSEEWAQLEELYGIERADAIKSATREAVGALEDFIRGLTSGPSSPLSRRTVYDNARAEVDRFRADIAAGKVVDQDALISALENLQSASEALFGSRSPFYADFEDILALAQAARNNVPITDTGALPPSPFTGDYRGTTPPTTPAPPTTGEQAIADLIGQTNGSIRAILQLMLGVLQNQSTTSPITNVPTNGGVTSGSGSGSPGGSTGTATGAGNGGLGGVLVGV